MKKVIYLSESQKFSLGAVLVWIGFLIFFILSYGCTISNAFAQKWEAPQAEVKNIKIDWILVPEEYLPNYCGWGTNTACAILNLGRKSCTVYLTTLAGECEKRHEKFHCAGWRHDNRITFIPDCGPDS